MSTGWRAAADIGGTFTDLMLVDPDGRCAAIQKLLTTPDDPADALVEGLRRLLDDAGVDTVDTVVHGTTLITNALIERRGAPTALITTRGFRDVLEIGREARYDLYDLDLELPKPIVPRRWRFEVSERVMSDGTVTVPLDEDAVVALAHRLYEEGITSVAVSFLHAYRFPAHEHRVAELLQQQTSGLDVTVSSDVLPQVGEYARTSTAVANAYIRPLVRRYLASLEDRIAIVAPGAIVALLASTGRVTPAVTARKAPIRLVESGPAGGVLAATTAGTRVGSIDLLAFDMGGTTAKASYVAGGRPRLSSSFEVARVRRFARGSGLPIQVPSIELIEIGAGGGSIATVDSLGLVRVGPRSAGSRPGPACYALGGSEPTVTDADLLLGYLDASSFLGGDMQLDVDAAEKALGVFAQQLGLDDPHEGARAVRRVVDEQMAAAARMHAVEQGLDSAAFALVATGGAGPVHACSIAKILRIRRVIAPARAGVASSHGFLGASYGFDVARSAPTPFNDLDWDVVDDILRELQREAAAAAGGVKGRRHIEADLRFRGQGDPVAVPVTDATVAARDTDALATGLRDEYRRRYGRVPEGVPPEVLTWRLAFAAAPPPLQPAMATAGRPRGERLVWFDDASEFVMTPVVGRREAEGIGPMIVEERESTLVVPPSATVTLADSSSVVVEL